MKRRYLAGVPIVLASYDFADSPFWRVLRFYSVAFPAYLHYEWTDRTNSDTVLRQTAFARLHSRYSPKMQKSVLEMRGFFLKAAQLMSVREDFLPDEYLQWTRSMQNEAPVSFTSLEAQEIVCEAFGLKKISEKFIFWDDVPIGSASIGQVYRATLLDGTAVAVKVQAPLAESQFRSDLKACKFFCSFALPHLVVPLEEIERQFATEFDYVREGANLTEIRNNLLPTWGTKIVIPAAHMCSKKVLVMDYVPGQKISSFFTQYLADLAEKQNKSVFEVQSELKQKLLQQGLSSWIGNIFSPTLKLLTLAMNVHGHQIFKNQMFNGDPHPGNLLITPDGKLGLVDFGQVKRLTKQRTTQIARLVLALNADDRNEVCAIMKEMGSHTENDDPDTVWRLTAFWFDRDTPDVTEGLDMHKFLEEMEKRDPQKSLCQDLVLVSRCSVMLRSLGLAFGLRVRTSDFWKPYAEEFLKTFSMLEVWLASLGSGIAGAAKGYAGAVNSRKPAQLFLGMTILSLVGINEAVRFQRRRAETRSHMFGASASLMDDTIIESSPTYLVDNSPLFVGIYAGAYALVGSCAWLLKRGAKGLIVR